MIVSKHVKRKKKGRKSGANSKDLKFYLYGLGILFWEETRSFGFFVFKVVPLKTSSSPALGAFSFSLSFSTMVSIIKVSVRFTSKTISIAVRVRV